MDLKADGTGERVVDQQYLQLLENKLKNLKSPQKITAKTFLSDIASFKDHQLFNLMTEPEKPGSQGFDDNFVEDSSLQPSYMRRKIAPQTCAISKQELVKLLKSDMVQMLHEENEQDDFAKELQEVAMELNIAKIVDSKDEEDPDWDKDITEESTAAISPDEKST